MTRSRVRGTFLGAFIGDALGKPVEGWPLQRISETFGRITDYKPCDGHKYFDGHPLGSTTDDAALTAAVAEALIEGGKMDMDAIAKHHISKVNTAGGFGKSTKEAILRMAAGVHWSKAGETDEPNRGMGNGVAMKMSPVGLYYGFRRDEMPSFESNVINIAYMTHPNPLGAASGLVMAYAHAYLFCLPKVTDYNHERMADAVSLQSAIADNKLPVEEQLAPRLRFAQQVKNHPDRIVSELKGGYHINESLPLTFAFFWRNPSSIETLYDVASAGGDTDSNASMVASMLGAMHGEDFFPDHLKRGLPEYEHAIGLADRFYDAFAPKEEKL